MSLRCRVQRLDRRLLAVFVLGIHSLACSIDRSPTQRVEHDDDPVQNGESPEHHGDDDPGVSQGDAPGDDTMDEPDGGTPGSAPQQVDGGDGPDSGDGSPVGTYALHIDGQDGEQLCRLNANHQRLIVRVTNSGSARSPATSLEVRTPDGEHVVRASVPELEAGAHKDVGFDRAVLVGYRDAWEFAVALDPDGLLGESEQKQGMCEGPRARAARGVGVLAQAYDLDSGTWPDGTWWHSARMLASLTDYMRETGDPLAFDFLAVTLDKQGKGNFLSESYDDEGYWALLWLKGYELTPRQRYLDLARSLFGDMTAAFSDSCKGGLFRGKVHGAKYASTNALMMRLSAWLARYADSEQNRAAYLSWAKGAWAWFKNTGMVGADQLVFDSLDQNCAPTGQKLTGNQGLLLGGLIELWQSTQDAALLDQADLIAQSVLANMVDADGVLREQCEPTCGEGDIILHKGMFVAELARLHALRPQVAYQTFLLRQTDSLWQSSKNDVDEFGASWAGPFDRPDPLRQAAALDALVASVRVEQPNIALGAKLGGSAPCLPYESADRVHDGSSRLDSKWCSAGGSGQFLTVEFDTLRTITGFRVRHAGAGGEDAGWNTRAFELEASADGHTFQPLLAVKDNTANVTTHFVSPFVAQEVRLHVSEAQTRMDAQAARIYELEVFGVGQP
jgi:hypothetical protein